MRRVSAPADHPSQYKAGSGRPNPQAPPPPIVAEVIFEDRFALPDVFDEGCPELLKNACAILTGSACRRYRRSGITLIVKPLHLPNQEIVRFFYLSMSLEKVDNKSWKLYLKMSWRLEGIMIP